MSANDITQNTYYSERRSEGKLHVAFDLDGTITEHNFPALGDPFPWVKRVFKTLVDNGYTIWVYSARFNSDFYGSKQAMIWFQECESWLSQHGLYDFVRLTPYKPPADIIFDDVGMQLQGQESFNLRAALNTLWAMSGGKIKWPQEVLKLVDDPIWEVPKEEELDNDWQFP